MRKRHKSAIEVKRPGDVLDKDVLEYYGITQEELGRAIGSTRFSINRIVNGRRSITADMAVRLAQVTGTTARHWMDLQSDYEIAQVDAKLGRTPHAFNLLQKRTRSGPS